MNYIFKKVSWHFIFLPVKKLFKKNFFRYENEKIKIFSFKM